MYCPSIENDPDGFLWASSTRIFQVCYLANHLVRRTTHYPTGGTTEVLLFAGLVRLASSSGMSWEPTIDLTEIFPLEVGRTHAFQTQEHLAGRDPVQVDNEIRVLRKERFKASGCTFEVLQLEAFASNEFKRYLRYSPSLRCVLTEQIGRPTGFPYTFHPLSELSSLKLKISNQAPGKIGA